MKRRKTKVTMKLVKDLAHERGIETLENKYTNANTRMSWKCSTCLHEWRTTYNNFRRAAGCPRCNGTAKYTLEEIQELVKKRGFELLDTKYVKSTIPMTWKCFTCSYQWQTALGNITRSADKGCPACKKHRSIYKIEEVHEICKRKNLTCLENKYTHGNIKMKFKCNKCEREWETTFRSIVQNIGCLKCTFNEKMKLNIAHVNNILKDRNIVCLDKKYINAKTPLTFQCCICTNYWTTPFNHIKYSNSGCPHCASYRSERICRELFQSFIGYNFPKKRPKFLKGLELDGFCTELKLAFEYQGQQHFEYVPYFHREKDALANQQERDQRKRDLCKDNDIILIEVPYQYDHKDPNKMEIYILKQLIKYDFIRTISLG